MTPREYLKRMCDAAEAVDIEKGEKAIRDYVKFAIDEIQKACDGNITSQTMWMWVYALRKIADILDPYISRTDKELMESFDECSGIHIAIDAIPYSEGDDNAEA